MKTLPQSDLPNDAGILRTAAQYNRANVGVYASVLQGGKIRRGDSLRLEQGQAGVGNPHGSRTIIRRIRDDVGEALFLHEARFFW